MKSYPEGLISIIDESGEDYIYTKADFIPVEQGGVLEEVVVQASKTFGE